MKGNQQQPPSAGAQMSFGPRATEQNGQLQRLLEVDPQIQSGPQDKQGLAGLLGQLGQSPGFQGVAIAPPAGGGGMGIPQTSQDPALAATMQELQGLFAASKQKKQDFAKAMMGVG